MERGHLGVAQRSIPACAGEPGYRTETPARYAVYPSLCGGTRILVIAALVGGGLSPPVRGNPPKPAPTLPPSRSIPACAGEPAELRPRALAASVYPRLCGGTTGM